jgi:hypothetical protein
MLEAGDEFERFEPSAILDALGRHGVAFLVVGGLGATAHGSRRDTYDLDAVANRSRENLTRLTGALRELGARLRLVEAGGIETFEVPLDAEMLDRMQISNWHTRFGNLDVLADIPSLGGPRRGYDELLADADQRLVAERLVIVASLDHIIDSKRAAGRPKDMEALPELEALRT